MAQDQTDNPQLDPLMVGEIISLQEAAAYAGLSKGSLLRWGAVLSSALVVSRWLVRKSAMRGPVEAAILECKSEVGMDQYHVRSWRGWHHHRTMTLLAHHFLVRQRCLLGEKAVALTVPQVRRLLQVVLPKRQLDAQTAIALIQYIQDQNYRA